MTIHVTATDAKAPLHRHLCSVAWTDVEAAKRIKEHPDPEHYRPHKQRHYLCASRELALPRELPFDILQVCRQIHEGMYTRTWRSLELSKTIINTFVSR